MALPQKDFLIASRYKALELIEKGRFSWKFAGEDMGNYSDAVLIKVEAFNHPSPAINTERQLFESFSSRRLQKFHFFGPYVNKYDVLIIENTGPSIEDFRLACEGKFSINTVLLLAGQMLDCLSELHKHGLVHCTLSPSSFCVGRGCKLNHILITDLEHAERYMLNGEHRPLTAGNTPKGSLLFSSLNALKGICQSRRDDLEALVEILIFLLKGSSPWPVSCEDPGEQFVIKQEFDLRKVFIEDHIPTIFADWLKYARRLEYSAEPDYGRLRHNLSLLYQRLYQRTRHFPEFDWVTRRKAYFRDSAGKEVSNNNITSDSPSV